jgi:ketosteroid isomerase-like protein
LLKRFQQAGIGEVSFLAEYLVEQGKIRFFAPTVTLTPEQQEKMKAAQANATPAAPPAVNPIDVAKAYVETANSGDFDKALSFYADSSAILVVNGTVLLSGKAQIAKWLKTDFQTTRATPDNWNAVGNAVVSTGMVSLERFKKLGVDPVQYRALYIVENGQIRFFRPFAILTPEQQAIVRAAQGTKAP